MVDLWDIYQHGQIEAANAAADAARDTALGVEERARRHVARLEARIDALSLLSQAMWELVRERTSLSDDDLRAKVAEIDVRDGRLDGRMLGSATQCKGCGRSAHTRQSACMYCGTAIERKHVFER